MIWRAEFWHSLRVVQANAYRQDVLVPQDGKQTGLQERGLAKAGHAEEDGQPLAQDETMQFVDLRFAAVKILLVLLGERLEPGQGFCASTAPVSEDGAAASAVMTIAPASDF